MISADIKRDVKDWQLYLKTFNRSTFPDLEIQCKAGYYFTFKLDQYSIPLDISGLEQGWEQSLNVQNRYLLTVPYFL